MMTEPYIHILRVPMKQGEWKPTCTAVRWSRGMSIVCECCECRWPTKGTEIRVDHPESEWGYYGPTFHFRCKANAGCNREPWKRIGMDARGGSWMNDGPPAFIRKRDGARFWFQE